MRSRQRAVAAALGWLLPTLAAQANGGPVAVAQGEATPIVGGLAPLRDSGIRLVAEDLTVRLRDDGTGYSVVARYVLANAGPPTRVPYAVPLRNLTESCQPFEDDDCGGRPGVPFYRNTLAALPGAIKIELAGRRFPCALAVPPDIEWQSKPPATARWDAAAMASSAGWCVAELAVPSGPRIPLTLAYDATFGFFDEYRFDTGTAARAPRSLEYLLFPASWWSGRPDRVRMTLEAGRFAGLVEIESPPGFAWNAERTRASWDLATPDLAALRALRAKVHVGPILEAEDLGHCRRSGRPRALFSGELELMPPVSVTASSTLAPQASSTYAPEHVFDGDPTTAWCEGSKGPGVGEWIELRWNESGDPAGYVLRPGYAKDDRTWLANRRVRSFRLAPCDRPADGMVVDLDPDANVAGYRLPSRAAYSALRVGSEGLSSVDAEGTQCVRLTLLAVTEGKHADACISEFFPLDVPCLHVDY